MKKRNKKNMEKVTIKRVKKNKKKISTKEKILAGLGLGTSLMGFSGVSQAPKQQTNIVSKQTKDQKSTAQKITEKIARYLSIPEAKADDSTGQGTNGNQA